MRVYLVSVTCFHFYTLFPPLSLSVRNLFNLCRRPDGHEEALVELAACFTLLHPLVLVDQVDVAKLLGWPPEEI